MELDWSTFLLEVINFLILVWLLKRFLYQPVLKVVTQRQQKIAAELSQAASGQEEVAALKQQYEARLADWEQEKRGMLEALEQQIEHERGKRLQQLDEELAQQRQKNLARDDQQRSQWRNQAETEALQLSAVFAARLLQGLAGSELDLRLQQLFIEQLPTLPESKRQELQNAAQGDSAIIDVASARPLDETRRQSVSQALEQMLGHSNCIWNFHADEQLIAGLRIAIGGQVLQANLQDELRFFSEAVVAHD